MLRYTIKQQQIAVLAGEFSANVLQLVIRTYTSMAYIHPNRTMMLFLWCIILTRVLGISQSYVSRYFKGDFQDMSERSRRAIQKWYVMFSKNPAAIGETKLSSKKIGLSYRL